jgi:hypothetical protein
MQFRFAGLLTPKDLAEPSVAERFLDLLEARAPDIVPSRYGSIEPVKLKYKSSAAAAKDWEQGFIWKGQQKSVEGTAFGWTPFSTRYSSVTISFGADIEAEQLTSFVQQAAEEFDVVFGYIHELNEREVALSPPQTVDGVDERDRSLVVAWSDLEKYIPNIYWGSILGRPYTSAIGRERLESVPAWLVRELDEGIFYFQLSSNIQDMQTQFRDIESARNRIKMHLGREWFFDPFLPPTYRYRTPPEFSFKP